MNNYNNFVLLAILAHPDDESYTLGNVINKYTKLGVEVHYLCGTRGECGEAPEECLKGYKDTGEMRWHELECACQVLGVKGLHYLGYRDSGMPGTESNKHSDALTNRSIEEVAERIARFINEIKPDVILTHDPIGDYQHIDHIMLNKATTMAFDKLVNSNNEYKPRKLYFRVFSRKLLRLSVKIYPFFGVDPKHYGKNKDVDLTSFANANFPTHAIIKVSSEDNRIKELAIACHKSQHWNRGGKSFLQSFLKTISKTEFFMRHYPKSDTREDDLFEGLI